MPPADRMAALSSHIGVAALSAAAAAAGTVFCAIRRTTLHSLPNQPERFAKQKRENNQRALNIDSVYDGKLVKGKNVIVTGANRGLGLALTKELVAQGANVIAVVRSAAPNVDGIFKVITGIDVQHDACVQKLANALGDMRVDIVINNAGYFMVEKEYLANANFPEEMKMIDICAVGQLRIAKGVMNNLTPGAKIAMITSQGGSIAWRDVQNGTSGPFDYGHHMSKAAANMGSKLLALEMQPKGHPVAVLHPGFNKTEMTAKYKEIWEVEGAVDPSVGAKRVIHEINILTLATSGRFINCEDGLEIPW